MKSALRDALVEAVRLWSSQSPKDLRRVVKPLESGIYHTSIEPFRGARTALDLQRALEGSEVVKKLDAAIRIHHPELLGWADIGSQGVPIQIGGTPTLTRVWCANVVRAQENGSSFEVAVSQLQEDISTLLNGDTVSQVWMSPISGLSLPTTCQSIELEPGCKLRRLNAEEIIELGSSELIMPPQVDVVEEQVSCALEIVSPTRIRFSVTPPECKYDGSERKALARTQATVLQCIHILKSGHASIAGTFSKVYPDVLPGIGSTSERPLVRSPFTGFSISADEIVLLKSLFADLKGARSEVKLAASRLVDASGRIQPTDSLLDCVIGLETLLKPQGTSETAFRVALNYAFLAPEKERRQRYEKVKNVQRTRNAIIHRGEALDDRNSETMHQHASDAKEVLRDAVFRILTSSELNGRKLTEDFWLTRLMPQGI